jgi:hypothetical protein
MALLSAPHCHIFFLDLVCIESMIVAIFVCPNTMIGAHNNTHNPLVCRLLLFWYVAKEVTTFLQNVIKYVDFFVDEEDKDDKDS